MPLTSYWLKSAKMSRFPRLGEDLKVDVIVIGGGMTGITAAYLLKKAGKKVALLERDRCVRVDSGHTTAHLTYVTDEPLQDLVKTFGRDHAQAAWDAGRAAIGQIAENVQSEDIDCEFARVPGFVHASWRDAAKDETDQLREGAKLAAELGFDASFVDEVPLARRPGIRFATQAKFHPVKYLTTLLKRIPGEGSFVFENSEAEEFLDNEMAVKVNGHTVRGDYLVLGTHVPLMGKAGMISSTLLQTKLAPYTTYAIGAQVAKGTVPQALFWDTSDPYYYLRVDPRPRFDYLIFGGEDHKTGQQEDANESFRRLEQTLLQILPEAKVDARWSGQVIETHDGLPYIGETAERQFVATGYAGNGMTFGTIAGMMAADAVLGRKNPWTDLFSVGRKKLASAWDYLKENLDYPYYFIKDKLTLSEGESLDDLKPGQGKVLSLGGQRVAASRDAEGKVTKLSPVCTHMGCLVHWNQADSTWDCPCHGSRFKVTGEVLGGPAEKPLEKSEGELT